MVVFKQTYKKMVFSLGTAIMTALTLILFSTFFKFLTFKTIYVESQITIQTISLIVMPYFQVFLLFLFPLYITINSVKFISDEIEDGTFLTTLSKPISRLRIIVEKFMALVFVNMSFCIATLSFVWWYTLYKTNSEVLFNIMLKVAPTMLWVSFIIQIILSIILAIFSLKLKSKVMIFLGLGFAVIGQMWPKINSQYIARNQNFTYVGTKANLENYTTVTNSQSRYKKYIAPFVFMDHMAQAYFQNIATTYEKFGSLDISEYIDYETMAVYNKEVIFEPIQIKTLNNAGEEVEETKYVVTKLKNWTTNTAIKWGYSIAAILLIAFGIYYFNKKDIV